jgi:UDP-2-acetamido-3-amino-2,3-dideoxy-glucuronate N-acetyltransferase
MVEPFVHPTAVVDAGVELGEGAKVWHFAHVCTGAQVGARCSLGQNVYVAPGVVLGVGCKVQNNVSLYEGVTCEADVFLGPSMVFTNVINPRAAIVRRGEFRNTLIRRGATVGANATIICGVTLGEYCFIGAGAVVTRDVPAYALVLGVPGTVVGWVSASGHRLSFDSAGLGVCPETGTRYQWKDGIVSIAS